MIKYIIILFIFLSVKLSLSQERCTVKVIGSPIFESGKYDFEECDSIQISKKIEKQLIQLGYFDSDYNIERNNHQFLVKIHLNKKFLYNIENASSYGNINTLLDVKQYERKLLEVLKSLANSGYPFAQIKLIDIDIQSDSIINGKWKIERNTKIFIDSISIKGNSKISSKILQNIIQVKKGDIYNESKINKIDFKLSTFESIKVVRPHHVFFKKPNKAIIEVFIDDITESRFDGIVGINSNEITQKTIITGEVNLNLKNVIHKGELIHFQWNRLRPSSQELEGKLEIPYLMASKIGLHTEGKLYRQDSSFSQNSMIIGLRYILSSNTNIELFYKTEQSNNLISTSNQNNTKRNLLGIQLAFQNLSSLYNPTKGFSILTNIATGNKKIESTITENNKLRDIEYSIFIEKYTAIWRRNILRLAIKNQSINNSVIYDNERLRFGGYQSLRGFNDNNFSATNFIIGTIEYRFILDQFSHFKVFGDIGYYESNTESEYRFDSPVGFGIGVNLKTKPGVISLNYALGAEQNNPILFRNAKVHLGFISVF